jgi:hypothetical protein
VYRVVLVEIIERPGKRAITKECVRLEIEDIGVLELVAAIEKMKAKRQSRAAQDNGSATS